MDYDNLVARIHRELEDCGHDDPCGYVVSGDIAEEAATAITTLTAQVEELEALLR